MAAASPAPAPTALRAGLLGLAFVAGVALVAATFGDVIVVDGTGGRRLAASTGLDRHGPAFLLLAAGCFVLGTLAWRGVRIAATGLVVVGLAALLIVVTGDVGDLRTTGRIAGVPDATTAAGPGFYLASLGGVLAVLAGGGLLLTGAPASRAGAVPARHT